MHDDQFDFSLVDDDLMDEVNLLTQLIIVASGSDVPLTAEQIDEALGIERPGDVAGA